MSLLGWVCIGLLLLFLVAVAVGLTFLGKAVATSLGWSEGPCGDALEDLEGDDLTD